MAERPNHYKSPPNRYSQEFYNLIVRAYEKKSDVFGSNDVNGIMINKGFIRKQEIVIFDIGIDHDILLKENKRDRDDSVILTYLPPMEGSYAQGTILVIASYLDETHVISCLEFITGSWPEFLTETNIRAISPPLEEDFPNNEHIVYQGKIKNY